MALKGNRRFVTVERPKIEERFSYADLISKQMERCLLAVGQGVIFEETVIALENMIPKSDVDDEYMQDLEESTDIIVDYSYKTACGAKMGTPEKPVYTNLPGDYDYDGGDPVLISPIQVERVVTDWNKRFRAAFNMYVRLGVAVKRTSISG